MGQVLQAGAGQAPARQAAIGRGPADRDARGHDQQGVRLVDSRDRDRRRDDPRGRPRVRRHRRHGVDVERAVPAQEGALRLPARQRRADRLDGLRRPHVDVRRAAHGAAERRRSRASSASRARSRTRWAYRSHQRAVAAQDAGRFDDEIVPVGDVAADEGPRRDTSLEKLAALKPVFDPEGTTTAGNAPGVNDGASCVVVTSGGVREAARARGAGDDPLAGATSPTTSRTSRARPRGRASGAREGGQVDRRRRARRDQRGVLVGRAQLDAAARRRRGERERERRRGRARPPDRRVGRPHRRRRWCTSSAETAAGSGSRRSAPAAARATRSCSRSERALLIARSSSRVAAREPSGTCPGMPTQRSLGARDERTDARDASHSSSLARRRRRVGCVERTRRRAARRLRCDDVSPRTSPSARPTRAGRSWLASEQTIAMQRSGAVTAGGDRADGLRSASASVNSAASARALRRFSADLSRLRRAAGRRAVTPRVSFEHVLVVGAGQMGGGIAQVVAASGRRVSLHDRVPRRDRARPRDDAQEPRAPRREGRRDPDDVLARVTPVDELVDADLMIEAVVEDAAVKRRRLRARRRRAARRSDPRVEHVVDPDHVARRGDDASRARDRHALLQPGAGAEARRGDPRGADLRRDGRGDRRSSRATSARSRRRRATSRASSRTAS